MMVQGTDLEVLRDIPGYKAILKALIKSQIQHLVEQLSSHTEEEAVLLTVCTADGSLSHLGSESGRGFLDANDDVKSKFLGFCLKQQHKIQTAESPIKPRPPVSQTQHSPAHRRQKFSPYPAPNSPGYARNQVRSFPQKPLPQTSPGPIMSSLAEYRQPPVSLNQTQNNTGVILKTESEMDDNSDQVAADSYPGYSTQTSQGYSTQTSQVYSTQTSQVYSTQTSQSYSTQTSQGDDTKAGMLQEHEDSLASVEADDSVNVKAEPNSDDELSIIGVDYGGGGGEGADSGQGEAGWLSGSEVGGASNDGMSKQVGARRQKYSVATLEHAADMVRSKAISLNMAARQYCIPKTTIHNAVKNRYGSHRVGKATVLTEAEETRVAEWAIGMTKIGYGRTRQELATTVKKIIEDDGRLNPFKNNKPGRAWMDGFIRRHPNLSPRTTSQLGKERALFFPEKISRWFSEFKNYIENELGDKTLLKDPTRIYNADKTGVSLCMKGSQVIGIKGASMQYNYDNSDKTKLTVMAACSASAHYLPPMIIFPDQRFSYNPLEGFEEAALGRSSNGWMDSEVFNNWLENVFVPGVNERNVKKPVLLLIDGHVTHVTMAASDICRKHGIELYCLLEHASHVLQPLDLRLFSVLKRNWRQAVRNWQSENIGENVTKVTFARVFKNAWFQSTTVDVAVKGFAAAGLFPLDPSVVLQSMKIEPSQLFANPRSNEQKSTDKVVEPSTENDVDSIPAPESEGNRRPTETKK